MSPLDGAGALLPPGPPQQETQQVEHEHGGLGEGAKEGLVVVLPLEDVLRAREATRRLFGTRIETVQLQFYLFFYCYFTFAGSKL